MIKFQLGFDFFEVFRDTLVLLISSQDRVIID